MLTKGQKIYMYVSAILVMIIGIVTFIPFRTLSFLCNESNIDTVASTELIIKLIIFPLVVIALSVFANVKKYQEIEDCLDRSKVVNVMSYFPIISYLTSILVFIIHTLSYSYEPLGFSVWSVVIVLLVLYLMFTIIAFPFLPNMILRLDLVGTVIFDCVLFVITVCFCLVAWRVDKSYVDLFAAEEGFIGKGDVLLFFLYVFSLVSVIVLCSRIYKMMKKDNRSIYVNPEMFERNYENLVKAEYNRAYNDIMDDFEEYFDEHYDDEWEEEPIVEEPVEETSPEEEPTEEQPVEPVEEEPTEEQPEEVEEPQPELTETTPEVSEPVREEPKEKVVKVIEPLYEDLLDFASKLGENISVNPNPKGTMHKLTAGKKLFLIMQKTNSDYRITFLAKSNYALGLINKIPGAIVKPNTPKGENWFKITNKGDLSEEILKEVITKSYDFATTPEAKPEPKKAIKPSYKEIVNMGSKINGEEINVVPNAAGTQHKFYYNKKMFLVTQKTNNDYRIIFLAPTDQAIELINDYPGVVVKPTSPKGDNWFKVTNKGDLERAFLKGLIVNSLATYKELEAAQKAEKERIARERREAKKALKEAEKANTNPQEEEQK